MRKNNGNSFFLLIKGGSVSSLIFVLFLSVSLVICSCNNDKIDAAEILIPINTIHINVLSWNSSLTQVDGIFLLNGKPYTGKLDNNLKNNSIKASVDLVDGLLHGTLSEVYPGGQIRTDKTYKGGYEKGPQKGWHSTGKLSYQYMGNGGVRDGLYQEYYPNGNLQVECFYDNGVETKRKVKDIEGDIIVNYEIKDGRYYGLLGSSSCITVFEDEQYNKSYED